MCSVSFGLHELGTHEMGKGLPATIIRNSFDLDETANDKRKTNDNVLILSYQQSVRPSTVSSECTPCHRKDMYIYIASTLTFAYYNRHPGDYAAMQAYVRAARSSI